MRWIVVLLALAACGQATDARGSGGEAPVLEGRYAAAHDALPRGAVLVFDDGDLSMNAGCNQLFGSYTLDGDRLSVYGVGGTEMGCEPALMAADEWLTAFFADPVTVTDGRLVAGDRELAISRDEVEDAELTGTRWVLDGLVQGDTVSSMPAGVRATLRIDAEGEAVADTGCNALTATVDVGPEDLHWHPGLTTLVGCAGVRGDVEAHVTKVLTARTPYEIAGQTLTITNGERGLVFRAADRDGG